MIKAGNRAVYELFCSANGKRYLGAAVNVQRRFTEHLGYLTRDKHDNRLLQDCWNEFGGKTFEFRILELVEGDLKLAEQNWLDRTLCELNVSKSAYSPMRDATPEMREKISVLHKGRVWTPEQIARAAAGRIGNRSRTGQKWTPEQKARMSQQRKGKKQPEGFGAKITLANNRRWEAWRQAKAQEK